MTTQSDESLREELKHMFASAWQDGVHHLNPNYLRRDTFFTDRAIKLIEAQVLQAQEALIERIQQSVDNHTTPEGKNLLTRSYVNNTLDYERKKLEELK